MAESPKPLVWRIPPWQPAALFLITSVCAALNLYFHPSVNVRIATIFVGLAALISAIASIRMYFVVDEDGIWVRRINNPRFVPWDDVRDIEITRLKQGNATLRVVRGDHSIIDIPPSLVAPTLPTRNTRALAALGNIQREVESRRQAYRR